MTSTCSSVVEILGQPDPGLSSVLSLSDLNYAAQSFTVKWEGESLAGICIMSTGARGVVVIAVGNEHGDTSSNPGRY